MTKMLNIKLVHKNEVSELFKSRFLCQPDTSSFQNIFCDGVVKVANYLKCHPTKNQSVLVIYVFETQLFGVGDLNESEFNSSVLKFSRCVEKLCPMYGFKIHLICVKMLTSIGIPVYDNNFIHNIRVLLSPVKDHLIIDTMDNLQLHYEYNFKEHLRYNTLKNVGEIELPSIDETRATLLVELSGTTLPACDLMATIFKEHERIQFSLLSTVPRNGLYPICILGNPAIVGPARSSISNLSLEETDNAILFSSLAKHLATTNTIFILQSFKKPNGVNVCPYERQFWGLIPPATGESHNPFEYLVESMVLIQLCDQDSFLICSNPATKFSTRPLEMNCDIEGYLIEEKERENEMKEFVETSSRLLESVEIYNPLAFTSRKYQPPIPSPPEVPRSLKSNHSIAVPQGIETNSNRPIDKTKSVTTTITPSKRPSPLATNVTTSSKIVSKRVKAHVDWAKDDIDEFEY